MNRNLLNIAILVIGFCPMLIACPAQAQGSFQGDNSGATLNQGFSDGARQVGGKTDRSSKDEAINNESKRRFEEAELDRLKSNYDDAVKQFGVDSWTAFVKGRYLVQWYIEQNQQAEAVPLCESFVRYCRISIDDIKSGATWNELRPSEKQDHVNLILCLTVLSELNGQQGNAERAADLLNDARKTYLEYQLKNPTSREQSFEQFSESNSVPNAVTQSKLASMLNWRAN